MWGGILVPATMEVFMKVWVLMGNDFPCGVATSARQARVLLYLEKRKDRKAGYATKVYYRSYEYELKFDHGKMPAHEQDAQTYGRHY